MEPLASKIRPKTLKEFFGQEHLVGAGKPTLAKIYAQSLDAKLYELSAVSAGKDDIKKILKEETGGVPKVLFLDEIHRFNKAQQDFLLPYVERGEITLIGATTEHPSFEVIPPLLSRCRVFVLNELNENDMRAIIKRAGLKLDKKAEDWVVNMANGDARQAIGILESTNELYKK